jgi:hypothetical protein
MRRTSGAATAISHRDELCSISSPDRRTSRYSTPHRPPQTLQHFRQQQQKLSLLDEIVPPTTVCKTMAPLDGDGPIDPPGRRIRRTPTRAQRRPAPPHVYRQQLYLHPEDMQLDHSYTWTRSSEGTKVTMSAARWREWAVTRIGITHIGPPRRASRLVGRIVMSCIYFSLVACSVGAPKNATRSERACSAQ